jgi:hypothetical protein
MTSQDLNFHIKEVVNGVPSLSNPQANQHRIALHETNKAPAATSDIPDTVTLMEAEDPTCDAVGPSQASPITKAGNVKAKQLLY